MALGFQEIIVIVLMLAMLTIPAIITLLVVWYFLLRRKSPPSPPTPASIQDRLLEIDSLRSKNLISDIEYEEKRRQILNGDDAP